MTTTRPRREVVSTIKDFEGRVYMGDVCPPPNAWTRGSLRVFKPRGGAPLIREISWDAYNAPGVLQCAVDDMARVLRRIDEIRADPTIPLEDIGLFEKNNGLQRGTV
jgi:hypothetical protein